MNVEFANINPFDCTGNPTSVGPRWRRWKRSFEFFLEAKCITKEAQKTSLTFALRWTGCTGHFCYAECLGPAPNGETQYAKAMRLLDANFLPQVNIPFEQHQFRQAKQEESETTDQLVTRLFQLSENWRTSDEEKVRDQLIDKCRSHDLRKKLLAVSGKLTLQKARDIARSMEAAESQARSMESDSRSGNVNSSERGHFDSPKRGGGLILRLRKKNEAIVRERIPYQRMMTYSTNSMEARCLENWTSHGDFTRLSWNNSLELLLHSLHTRGCTGINA